MLVSRAAAHGTWLLSRLLAAMIFCSKIWHFIGLYIKDACYTDRTNIIIAEERLILPYELLWLGKRFIYICNDKTYLTGCYFIFHVWLFSCTMVSISNFLFWRFHFEGSKPITTKALSLCKELKVTR